MEPEEAVQLVKRWKGVDDTLEHHNVIQDIVEQAKANKLDVTSEIMGFLIVMFETHKDDDFWYCLASVRAICGGAWFGMIRGEHEHIKALVEIKRIMDEGDDYACINDVLDGLNRV